MYTMGYSIEKKHNLCGGVRRDKCRRKALKEESKLMRRSPFPERRSSRRRCGGNVRDELFKHMLIIESKIMPSIGSYDPKIEIPAFVNALADICNDNKYGSNTFHYSVDVFLRYLSVLRTRKKECGFQALMGACLASLSVASKYEDDGDYFFEEEIDKFLATYHPEWDAKWMLGSIFLCEQDILLALDFQISRATTLWFMENTMKECKKVVRGMVIGRKEVAKCLLELAYLRPAIFTTFKRSQIGAAATFVAGEIVTGTLEKDVLNECDEELTKVVLEHFEEMSGGTGTVTGVMRLQSSACLELIKSSLTLMERRKEDEMDLD